ESCPAEDRYKANFPFAATGISSKSTRRRKKHCHDTIWESIGRTRAISCMRLENGKKIKEIEVQQTAEGLAEFGRWLDERRSAGTELWAAIEKPQGRIVDFLLDHGVVVYPVNPKALDRARDRFRMSQSKSDGFDAYVLAEFLRTDHSHLR